MLSNMIYPSHDIKLQSTLYKIFDSLFESFLSRQSPSKLECEHDDLIFIQIGQYSVELQVFYVQLSKKATKLAAP